MFFGVICQPWNVCTAAVLTRMNMYKYSGVLGLVKLGCGVRLQGAIRADCVAHTRPPCCSCSSKVELKRDFCIDIVAMPAGVRLSYSALHRKRLLTHGTELALYLQRHSNRVHFWQAEPHLLGELFSNFVAHKHQLQERGGLIAANHALLFVQPLRPELRGKLPSAWSTLKSWEESFPSSFRVPLPMPLLIAMLSAHAEKIIRCGLCLLRCWSLDFGACYALENSVLCCVKT